LIEATGTPNSEEKRKRKKGRGHSKLILTITHEVDIETGAKN
jgi:hypothetical protein